jgi:hypothetical protein
LLGGRLDFGINVGGYLGVYSVGLGVFSLEFSSQTKFKY